MRPRRPGAQARVPEPEKAFHSPAFFLCLAAMIRCCREPEEALERPRTPWTNALRRAVRRRGWREFAGKALEHISFEELQKGLARHGITLVREATH